MSFVPLVPLFLGLILGQDRTSLLGVSTVVYGAEGNEMDKPTEPVDVGLIIVLIILALVTVYAVTTVVGV